MTMLNPILKREPSAMPAHRFFEVRWGCAITSWTDRFGALCEPERRHGRISFVVSLELFDFQRGLLEAWIEAGELRQTVMAGRPVACEILHDGGLLHVDALTDGAKKVLALSLDERAGRPAFAQSAILAEAGLGGGSYDPPTVQRYAARHDAVSA